MSGYPQAPVQSSAPPPPYYPDQQQQQGYYPQQQYPTSQQGFYPAQQQTYPQNTIVIALPQPQHTTVIVQDENRRHNDDLNCCLCTLCLALVNAVGLCCFVNWNCCC